MAVVTAAGEAVAGWVATAGARVAESMGAAMEAASTVQEGLPAEEAAAAEAVAQKAAAAMDLVGVEGARVEGAKAAVAAAAAAAAMAAVADMLAVVAEMRE